MNYIRKMIIKGFKKFKYFEIEFNEQTNILIGDNESGKSTILEAIDLVINKRYSNYDKYIIKDIINSDMITNFETQKNYESLPLIEIYVFFNLDNECNNRHEFWGEIKINGTKQEDYGIKYVCKLNEEFRNELMSAINEGKMPYEYYEMSWETFQGKAYNPLRKPLKFLSIDNSKIDSSNSFNYYNKNLYLSKHDNSKRMKLSNDFRNEINVLLDNLGAEKLSENAKFGIDNKKVILENILTVIEEGVSLENKGKGRENLIKTEIALSRGEEKFNVVAIEEPENHLSHINLRKMLQNIKKVNDENTNTQLIITTHNSLIVNTLNLSNLIWINGNQTQKMKSLIDTKEGIEIAKFFEKADNLNLLQYILSPKVILVEGPTEYLLIQYAYPKIVNDILKEEQIDKGHQTLEDEGIEIISCGGVSYKNYIKLAEFLGKKVAILTDNDYLTNEKKIEEIEEFNKNYKNIKIFSEKEKENWTWEVALYNLNKEILEEKITLKKGCEYKYKCGNKEYCGCLGKMLNQKTEIAYLLVNEQIDLSYPDSLKECIRWIRK